MCTFPRKEDTPASLFRRAKEAIQRGDEVPPDLLKAISDWVLKSDLKHEAEVREQRWLVAMG